MKILLTLFDINDFGGIVDDVEYLGRGLREHGHQVDLIYLRLSEREPYIRNFHKDQPGDTPSVYGGRVNVLRGWDGVPVYGYQGELNAARLHNTMEAYDLVIHEIPNPKPDPEGWWRKIYDADVNQIIAAHDAHYRDMYPHIAEVAHRITAITCTNHAGYVALEHCPIPRAFIGAAHIPLDWRTVPPVNIRYHQTVCAHVWKAWKQMDKVVRAGPLLEHSQLWMAGDGIEGRYMRSVDKCKPKYEGIWQEFLNHPSTCHWAGLVDRNTLYRKYRESKLMVDMSYSRKFAALGNHFNRSILEAANNGCISLCTVENMAENNPQVELWKRGKTHLEVPADMPPLELARIIDSIHHDLHPDDYNTILMNARQVLADHFDYRKTSLQYLELAQGKPAGIYPVLETGAVP